MLVETLVDEMNIIHDYGSIHRHLYEANVEITANEKTLYWKIPSIGEKAASHLIGITLLYAPHLPRSQSSSSV